MRKIFAIVLLFIATNMNAQETLIYVGDPMCSWCYGFAPELEKVIEEHIGEIEIELVTGGLRPYFKKPINEMKDFLSHHWEDVHKASGQPFNYDILNRADLTYDTEPACRAVVVVRQMSPQKEFEFFKLVQEAFYYHNKDLRSVESYEVILESLGLDKEEFARRFNSEEYQELVRRDFERAVELGVHGFPCILLQSGDQLIVITSGYASAKEVSAAISKAREKK